MFLFCFIPSNKHGCLTYRSFKSFWITFVPPTASSIMSKLPELFYLSLFVNDFKHAFTYRGMYDLNKKKKKTWSKSPRRNNLGQVAQSCAQVSFFNRNIPGWRFYNLRGQLIPIFDCHHSDFFFSLYPVQISDVMTHALCDSCPIAVHLWEKPGSFFSCIM